MSPYEVLAEWSEWWWPLLANHLWQATLFSLLALAVAASLRRAPALARYIVWLLALAKFALPSALLILLTAQLGFDLPAFSSEETGSGALAVSPLLSPVSQPTPSLLAADAVPHDIGASAPAASPPTYVVVGNLYGAVTCVWLMGCAVLMASWLRRSRALSVSLKRGREMSGGREAATLKKVRAWLGLRREVRLLITPAVSEPGVWGVFRPVVVLPEGVAEQLENEELEAVFMHELSHVERWDNLADNFQRALCCVFWFHPVVWLIDRRLLAEREQACDDVVVRLVGASEVYVNGIAKVCRYCLGREAVGLAKVTGSDLKKRVERIMSRRAGKKLSPAHAAALVLMSAAAVTLSVASGGADTAVRERPWVEASSSSSDTRLEAATPAVQSRAESAGELSRARAVGGTRAPDVAVAIPRKETVSSDVLLGIRGDDAIKADASTARTEAQADSTSHDEAPPEPPPPPSADAPPPHADDIRAAVVNASSVGYEIPRGLTGRYEVDPKRAENFILDITLEGGELWLKPSHSPKRRLIRESETDFTDAYSEHELTIIPDGRGRVAGLLLKNWGSNVTARKLILPRPSLNGNVTFRLPGFADAKVVAVAGEFNNWNQSQFLFVREGGGWVCRVMLPAGTHQYKFIVDGNWLTDPTNPETVRDRRGIQNSLLRTD
ncbi:MAG TPA: M56 family metallopeptidase [Pyrinomonadaceae bacterium]